MTHLTPDTFDQYLDGQLDPNARAAADAHLATCAQCRDELETLRQLFVSLDELQPQPIPIDITPMVLARIAPGPQRSRAAFARGLLGAQVILVIVLAVWLSPTLTRWIPWNLPALSVVPTRDPSAGLLAWLSSSMVVPQVVLDNLTRAGVDAFAGVAPMHWGLVVVAAGVVWLVGNRLLLAGPRWSGDSRQEAA